MGARRAVCGVGERRTCSASGSEPHVTCGTTPCSCRMSRHASVGGGGGGGGGDEVACRAAAATRRVRASTSACEDCGADVRALSSHRPRVL